MTITGTRSIGEPDQERVYALFANADTRFHIGGAVGIDTAAVPRTAKVMGDNCQSGWGCAGAYTYPHTTDDRLWSATVTLS